jgi:hypothetical protein
VKITSRELVSIIKAHREDSLGVEDGELSGERAKALNHYHGRPYGNEVDGRSRVVSKDLAEAVDWALPSIIRTFVQSGNIAEFCPVGPEDEKLAQQESDYVNRVFMQDNNGFLVLHDVFKDAMLLKNGYVKHYWHEDEKVTEESYTGLSMEQVIMLMQDLEEDGAEVEVKEQEITPTSIEGMMIDLYRIKLQIKRKQGRCVTEAVPTEEARVSKKCRGSLQDSPFVEHVTRKTRSDLIEMGMSRDFVDELPSYNERDNNSEQLSRDSVDDESDDYGQSYIDRSMDEIEFCEAYLRVDYDGDGVAELRKVVTVANRIPPGEEWNEVIEAVPMTGFVMKRVPHRHVGESMDDELSDLQEIKTTLMRQLLDNVYSTNNNQWIVNERVNLKDFLTNLPGGVKRVKGMEPIGNSVESVMTTPILDKILPVVDFMDKVKESRTGITKASTGLDPDTLKESTKGAYMENLNRASQKVEMIARLLAEGVKEMVLQIHGILLRHQDKQRMVQMRGEWVQVNPAEWRERNDVTVKVGLGTGNEAEKREKLMMVAMMQEKLFQIGMVGPEQAYSLFEDTAKAIGIDAPQKYVMSPGSPEFIKAQQQKASQPNPEVQKVQAQAQATMQAKQAELQVQSQNDMRDGAREDARMQQEAMLEQARIEAEERKHQRELAFKQWEKEAMAEIELEKARIAANTSLNVAQISAGATLTPEQDAASDGSIEQPVDPTQRIIESFAQMMTMQMQKQDESIARIAEMMSRPKSIVRGPDGKAIGVK